MTFPKINSSDKSNPKLHIFNCIFTKCVSMLFEIGSKKLMQKPQTKELTR